MVKQPGHFTSMKKERGAGTSVWSSEVSVRSVCEGCWSNWDIVLGGDLYL